MNNILVCLSSVPETTSKVKFSEDAILFDATGVQFIINPNDEFALTRAIQLKEDCHAKVTIISVGDSSVDPILRKALAIGADDAIRVDYIPKSSLDTSKQLASVAKNRNFDCILLGIESIDYNGGSVPAMLSIELGLAYVNNCTSLKIEEKDKFHCVREIDDKKETVIVDSPVVIAAQRGLVMEKDLKMPNIRSIMQARQKTIEVIEPVKLSTLQMVKSYDNPTEKSPIEMIRLDDIDKLILELDKKVKII